MGSLAHPIFGCITKMARGNDTGMGSVTPALDNMATYWANRRYKRFSSYKYTLIDRKTGNHSQGRRQPALFGSRAESVGGGPLSIAWREALLRSAKYASAPNGEYRFNISARNFGDDPVKIKDAYIVSLVDSTKIYMFISDPNSDLITVENAGTVPPGADIFITARFPEDTSEATILRRWGLFNVVIEYDNKQEKRKFERDWVIQQIIANDPSARPHLLKNKQ